MTAIDALTAPAQPRRPALNRTLWGVQIVMALFFAVAAAGPKLAGEQTAVEMFNQMGPGTWFRYLVGVLELAGGIGLLIPRLTRAAALGLIGVMVGAIYTNVVVLDTGVMALTPAVLIVVFGLIVWGRRPQVSSSHS